MLLAFEHMIATLLPNVSFSQDYIVNITAVLYVEKIYCRAFTAVYLYALCMLDFVDGQRNAWAHRRGQVCGFDVAALDAGRFV